MPIISIYDECKPVLHDRCMLIRDVLGYGQVVFNKTLKIGDFNRRVTDCYGRSRVGTDET